MREEYLVKNLSRFIYNTVTSAKKKGVVIGLSGGMDSAVCLALATRALEPGNCRALYMPHTGSGEIKPAAKIVAEHLKVELKIYDLRMLTNKFVEITGARGPLSRGNFGARLRSAFLYEEAAALDYLVLNTSNRSERMTGYFTKWGDESGDLSPLGNYYKTEVGRIGKFMGLPPEVLEAPPSADFFADQKDEVELGISYRELDRTLKFIETGTGKAEPDTLEQVRDMIKKSGHKRNSPIVAPRID